MNYTEILVALIAAGLLKYAVDGIRWIAKRRSQATPSGRQAMSISTVDQSLTVVARARDELESDNVRLRAEIAEKDARYAAEMSRRDAREAALREEVIRLEQRVREILTEVESLKLRTS